MTGELSVLRIDGFQTSNLKTGALTDESEAYQRTSPPHARGHGGAQIQRSDLLELYPPHRGVCQVPRPLSRHGHCGRRAAFPGAYDRERRTAVEPQQRSLGTAFLLWQNLGLGAPPPALTETWSQTWPI